MHTVTKKKLDFIKIYNFCASNDTKKKCGEKNCKSYLKATCSLQMVIAAMKLKDVYSLEGKLSRQHIKKQRHYFANNGLSSQGYGFSSGHVWMLELDYKES